MVLTYQSKLETEPLRSFSKFPSCYNCLSLACFPISPLCYAVALLSSSYFPPVVLSGLPIFHPSYFRLSFPHFSTTLSSPFFLRGYLPFSICLRFALCLLSLRFSHSNLSVSFFLCLSIIQFLSFSSSLST